MPIARYEIAADEAWTHSSLPLNRYWCFHGGVFGPDSDCDRLETALRDAVKTHGLKGEIKWSAVTGVNVNIYKKLLDVFFQQLTSHPLTYRQVFLDRSFVRIAAPGEPIRSPLDTQYRIYYQFLKHSFGLKFLPEIDSATDYHVTIRLDNHSSQKHTAQLTSFAENLGAALKVPRLTTKVQFVNSKKFLRLQMCDLLMGAAGSHGNKMHQRRDQGKRGMTSKQKCRFEMATYIYDCLRQLDAAERGSKAFSWFESTGTDGASDNYLRHKLRIWKFIPARYQIDKGWQNDHLDKYGRYFGPQVEPLVRSLDAAAPFPPVE